MQSRKLSLLTDLYELTMMQGYHVYDIAKKDVVFDMYYRSNPDGAAYSVFAGLEQVIDYIQNINFTKDDLKYLKSLGLFNDDFLCKLENFKFTGTIYAMQEGNIIFPEEPLIRVQANAFEAQLIETAVLNIINHQSLIASKASRIFYAAKGDDILEFGLRRAQGPDAGVYGARAAVIGGAIATSNVLAAKMFKIQARGTHAHSWVMNFDKEIDAFRAYAHLYPQACILLVDTYDTLKSGLANAIKVFDEMKEKNIDFKNYGIRLDSGDLSYLSKKARKMLDDAGHEKAIISASNDLDEYLIDDLKRQDAKIQVWGVGTKLITSHSCPSFGGVYKLAAEKNAGKYIPKIKLSDNPGKVTTPGVKKVFRIFDSKNNKIKADLICLIDEEIDENKDLLLFDPKATWKKMLLKAGKFYAKELLIPIFIDGNLVYDSPDVYKIRENFKASFSTLWDENKRFYNPSIIPVDLSLKLYNLKQKMINDYTV